MYELRRLGLPVATFTVSYNRTSFNANVSELSCCVASKKHACILKCIIHKAAAINKHSAATVQSPAHTLTRISLLQSSNDY